jgi:RNA polymerase sigma-70 factor (ECF subfamily)
VTPKDVEGLLDTPASIPETRATRRAELVAAARGGDRRAFEELVAPDVPRALGAARILVGSPSDAADAVQEALLSAWRGLDGLRDAEAFPAWFRRHVVRAALRLAKRPRVSDLAEVDAFVPDDLDRHVERRQLGRAFDRLDDRDRTLLTLHHFWGLPVAETASHLGIPQGTVKSRVHHAMTRLRAAYDAEGRR